MVIIFGILPLIGAAIIFFMRSSIGARLGTKFQGVYSLVPMLVLLLTIVLFIASVGSRMWLKVNLDSIDASITWTLREYTVDVGGQGTTKSDCALLTGFIDPSNCDDSIKTGKAALGTGIVVILATCFLGIGLLLKKFNVAPSVKLFTDGDRVSRIFAYITGLFAFFFGMIGFGAYGNTTPEYSSPHSDVSQTFSSSYGTHVAASLMALSYTLIVWAAVKYGEEVGYQRQGDDRPAFADGGAGAGADLHSAPAVAPGATTSTGPSAYQDPAL